MTPRQIARAAGLAQYQGKPCKRGHTRRRISDGHCVECQRASDAKWKAANPEKACAYNAKWAKANPGKYAAKHARREATKLRATPKWLTQEQHRQITELYELAALMDGWHVDHIVPLRGRNVCGLHVPWTLQLLPPNLNISKGNRLVDNGEPHHWQEFDYSRFAL
jgi:hypothetical protein